MNLRNILIFAICFLTFSCKKTVLKPQTQYVLGTICNINLFESGTSDLYQELFSELNAIDDKFNVNKEYSEISVVNQNAGSGIATNVSQEVYELVRRSKEYAMLTENSFNPLLGAIIKLWGIGSDFQKVPEEKEIQEAIKHCDPNSIVLSQTDGMYFIEITDKNASLDLGAIVKGFAADKLVKLLKEKKVSRAILDLGGNIYVFGDKSKSDQNSLWQVGIKNPIMPQANPIEIVSLKAGSVVTSGNYERFFIQDGIVYHHIFDGKTGRPAQSGLASVTVISENSELCDVLATALFVAGTTENFIKRFDEQTIKIVFVDLDGTVQILSI